MAPDRDDGIEEEAFEFEDDDLKIDLPQPKAGRAKRGHEEEEYDEQYDEEVDEEYDEEYEEGAPRGKLDSALAGISPKTLKLVLVGVVVFAVALVVLASRYKKEQAEKEKDAHEQRQIQRALKFVAELKLIGDDFFRTGGDLPPDFKTRFRPEPGRADDERRYILGVGIQSQPPGSVTFDTRATAFNHEFTGGNEIGQLNPKPLPGTEVYMSKATVAIKQEEYDIRIYRQVIKGADGIVVGRVALMMFPEK